MRRTVSRLVLGLIPALHGAANGQEALAVYYAHWGEIALVLTDMMMPKMGGQALHETLRQIDPAVRTVLVSGYNLEDNARGLEAQGISGWVQKPLSLQALAQVVRQTLDADTE